MLLVGKQLAELRYIFSMFIFSHIYMLSATINHRERHIKRKHISWNNLHMHQAEMLMLAQEQGL